MNDNIMKTLLCYGEVALFILNIQILLMFQKFGILFKFQYKIKFFLEHRIE